MGCFDVPREPVDPVLRAFHRAVQVAGDGAHALALADGTLDFPVIEGPFSVVVYGKGALGKALFFFFSLEADDCADDPGHVETCGMPVALVVFGLVEVVAAAWIRAERWLHGVPLPCSRSGVPQHFKFLTSFEELVTRYALLRQCNAATAATTRRSSSGEAATAARLP